VPLVDDLGNRRAPVRGLATEFVKNQHRGGESRRDERRLAFPERMRGACTGQSVRAGVQVPCGNVAPPRPVTFDPCPQHRDGKRRLARTRRS
jgi:hypothetical protein